MPKIKIRLEKWQKVSLKVILVAMIINTLCLIYFERHNIKSYFSKDYETLYNKIEKDHSVKIVRVMGEALVLDSSIRNSWPHSDINDFRLLSEYLDRASPRAIQASLERYPPEVIKENLGAIFLFNDMWSHGLPIGGTYKEAGQSGKGFVYIARDSGFHGAQNETTELTFHHEFSSILMHRYNFPKELWSNKNLKEFNYEDDPRRYQNSWLRFGASEYAWKRGGKEFYEKGFTEFYGTSHLENDVNTYAHTVFTDPEKMQELVENYPIVREKYLVLKEFYLGIHPDFERVFEPIL